MKTSRMRKDYDKTMELMVEFGLDGDSLYERAAKMREIIGKQNEVLEGCNGIMLNQSDVIQRLVASMNPSVGQNGGN
jgi:hypothetical protein